MISYAHGQRPLAQQLHERLKDRGCHPKLDHLDIPGGDRWRETVAWWLSACRTAVVLLSREAIASPWVRYELSVLCNRELVEQNVRLVLVYVGVSPDAVHRERALAPLQLGDIQTWHKLPDANPDADVVAALAEAIHELADAGDPPVDRLVSRVCDEVREVGPNRMADARNALEATANDPWLADVEDVRQGFAQAFCSTPLERTYDSLQTLAQDRHLIAKDLDKLVDFNVMTTFDSRTMDHLRQAGLGQASRSMVSAITQEDLAEVATRTVHEIHGTNLAHRFTVNGPVSGVTSEDVAEGLAAELYDAIATRWDEDPYEFLADMAHRKHPVFALLTNAVGLTNEALSLLEGRFPWIVFVILSSPDLPMPQLAKDLDIEGTGADLDDAMAWAYHVAHELALSDERTSMRKNLRRVRVASQR